MSFTLKVISITSTMKLYRFEKQGLYIKKYKEF
jgi:hypothetical protein